jgi:hypothetical protein
MLSQARGAVMNSVGNVLQAGKRSRGMVETLMQPNASFERVFIAPQDCEGQVSMKLFERGMGENDIVLRRLECKATNQGQGGF